MTSTSIRAPKPRVAPLARAALVILASMLAFSLLSRGSPTPAQEGGDTPMSIDQTEFGAMTGVWIEHVALLASDGIIEIRYRTLDSDLSVIVHDTVQPPRLITAEGLEFGTPRHEHPHDRVNTVGTTYNEQVMNVGGVIERGDIVTVAVGAELLPGVPVQ